MSRIEPENLPLPEPPKPAKQKDPEPDIPDEYRVDRSYFEGKEPASPKDRMEWIFQHLPLDDVDPSDCPDSGTWGYFTKLRFDGDARTKFYETVYPKFIGKDIERTNIFEDDKRIRLAVIDRLLGEVDG